MPGSLQDVGARAQLSWQARVLTAACSVLPEVAPLGQPSVFKPDAFAALIAPDPAPTPERQPPAAEHLRVQLARAPLAGLLARDDAAAVSVPDSSQSAIWKAAVAACDAQLSATAQQCAIFKSQHGDTLAPGWTADILHADGAQSQ